MTIRQIIDRQAIEIVEEAEGRDFTQEEADELHFFRSLAQQEYIARYRRNMGYDDQAKVAA